MVSQGNRSHNNGALRESAMKQNTFSFSVRENEIVLIQNYSYNATESSNY